MMKCRPSWHWKCLSRYSPSRSELQDPVFVQTVVWPSSLTWKFYVMSELLVISWRLLSCWLQDILWPHPQRSQRTWNWRGRIPCHHLSPYPAILWNNFKWCVSCEFYLADLSFASSQLSTGSHAQVSGGKTWTGVQLVEVQCDPFHTAGAWPWRQWGWCWDWGLSPVLLHTSHTLVTASLLLLLSLFILRQSGFFLRLQSNPAALSSPSSELRVRQSPLPGSE